MREEKEERENVHLRVVKYDGVVRESESHTIFQEYEFSAKRNHRFE